MWEIAQMAVICKCIAFKVILLKYNSFQMIFTQFPPCIGPDCVTNCDNITLNIYTTLEPSAVSVCKHNYYVIFIINHRSCCDYGSSENVSSYWCVHVWLMQNISLDKLTQTLLHPFDIHDFLLSPHDKIPGWW